MKIYLNGKFDENGNSKPFYWNKPILDGGEDGSDFTIAQRTIPNWPDYSENEPTNETGFSGVLAGLAVYNRALTADEIAGIYNATMGD